MFPTSPGSKHLPSPSGPHAVHDACRSAGIPTDTLITAEPGRSIVASAGMTLYRVGTIKVIPGVRTYVAVDGGMSDNPRPVLYGSGYEAFLPREPGAARPRAARVVGKHCESGDVVVADARLPADLAVGDIVATPVTGAYGYSMASNYEQGDATCGRVRLRRCCPTRRPARDRRRPDPSRMSAVVGDPVVQAESPAGGSVS